jgi:parvulin-like peptidyl-prolyl isomerase
MKKCIIIILALVICCAKENTPKDGAIKVNATWIKKDDIDRLLELYKQEMLRSSPGSAFEGQSMALPPTVVKNIAKQLVANEVVLQEAKKRKTPYDAAKARQMIESIKKQFPDSASLDRELAKIGQTRQNMWDQVKEGLMIQSLVASLAKPGDSVTAKMCKDYYDSNVTKLSSGKRYRASQILFTVTKGATSEKKTEITRKANAALAEIKAGKDFAAAAKKYSEDPGTKQLGGDIGWFKQGDLKREFDSVVSGLKQDEVSNVFETDAGFHIVKKTGEEKLSPPSFDEVNGQIKKTIELKKQNDVVKHFVDSLTTLAKITYSDTAYKPDESLFSK